MNDAVEPHELPALSITRPSKRVAEVVLAIDRISKDAGSVVLPGKLASTRIGPATSPAVNGASTCPVTLDGSVTVGVAPSRVGK